MKTRLKRIEYPFDGLAGQWAQQQTAPVPRSPLVIAVDGKTLRGPGTAARTAGTC